MSPKQASASEETSEPLVVTLAWGQGSVAVSTDHQRLAVKVRGPVNLLEVAVTTQQVKWATRTRTPTSSRDLSGVNSLLSVEQLV